MAISMGKCTWTRHDIDTVEACRRGDEESRLLVATKSAVPDHIGMPGGTADNPGCP